MGLGPARPAQAVVQWSRQYNIPCSACHQGFPRLNEMGNQFRRNGYRFVSGGKGSENLSHFVGPTWSPSMTVVGGGEMTTSTRGIKIHVGGGLSEGIGFLVQPTPGEKADFNMAQGLIARRLGSGQLRLTGGRLYAWGNGGGVGAADRFPTATLPRMLATLQGVTAGGLGNGFRLDYTSSGNTTVSAFSTDLRATAVAAQTRGWSLTQRIDPHHSSYIEVFGARSEVPVAGRAAVHSERLGVFANRVLADAKGTERGNLLGGALYGTSDRPLSAGGSAHLSAGFVEADWLPGASRVVLLRSDWERDVAPGKTRTGLTLGGAIPLTATARLDLDYALRRLAPTTPRIVGRMRFVY